MLFLIPKDLFSEKSVKCMPMDKRKPKKKFVTVPKSSFISLSLSVSVSVCYQFLSTARYQKIDCTTAVGGPVVLPCHVTVSPVRSVPKSQPFSKIQIFSFVPA